MNLRYPKLAPNEENYFYKYATVEAAEAILRNRTLRWSKPKLFNDPFEFKFSVTRQFEFSKIKEQVRTRLEEVFSGAARPAQGSPVGELVERVIAMKPSREKFDQFAECHIKSLEASFSKLQNGSASVADLRKQLEDAKVLCLTAEPASVLMWSHYAAEHSGVVFKFENRIEADSFLGAAQRVIYSKEFPCLYNEGEFVDLISGLYSLEVNKLLGDIVLTKSSDWSYEKEWRVILHMDDPNQDSKFVPFNAKELAGIIFGLRTDKRKIAELAAVSQKLNSDVALYQTQQNENAFSLNICALV